MRGVRIHSIYKGCRVPIICHPFSAPLEVHKVLSMPTAVNWLSQRTPVLCLSEPFWLTAWQFICSLFEMTGCGQSKRKVVFFLQSAGIQLQLAVGSPLSWLIRLIAAGCGIVQYCIKSPAVLLCQCHPTNSNLLASREWAHYFKEWFWWINIFHPVLGFRWITVLLKGHQHHLFKIIDKWTFRIFWIMFLSRW